MSAPVPGSADTGSIFLPLLLLAIAVAGGTAFQTWQLYRDQLSLTALIANQDQPLQNAQKLRAQLQAIATDTQQLADAGNANAKTIVDELKRRGVTINANPAPAAPAK